MNIVQSCHQFHHYIYRVGSAYAEFPPPPGCLLLCEGPGGAWPVQASPSSVPELGQCIGVHKYLINVNKLRQQFIFPVLKIQFNEKQENKIELDSQVNWKLSAFCCEFVILTNFEQTRTAEPVCPVRVMMGQGEDTCVEWDTCHRGHVRDRVVAAEVSIEPEHLKLIIKCFDQTILTSNLSISETDRREVPCSRHWLCVQAEVESLDKILSFVFYILPVWIRHSCEWQPPVYFWLKDTKNFRTGTVNHDNNSPEGGDSRHRSGGNPAAGQRGELGGMWAPSDTRYRLKF